jgi:hypothetical protein
MIECQGGSLVEAYCTGLHRAYPRLEARYASNPCNPMRAGL